MASILAGASHFTISGGTFSIHQSRSNALEHGSAFNKLSAATAHSALHDAPARTDETRCHQFTRENVLEHLECWAQGVRDKEASIFWLHGGAGAGKSAIMQTMAERLVAQKLALGSFFFSRSDPTRNTAEALIPTLSYQLSQSFPEVIQILDTVIERDPLIFKKALQSQLLGLFVHPLQHLVQLGRITDNSRTPRVFLIDGLDECNDPFQQQAILQAVAALCHEHRIPLKFLIASRPEHVISASFRRYAEDYHILGAIPLSEDPDAKDDIQRFIENEFSKIRLQHPFRDIIPSNWPLFTDVDMLVFKSSSHFIYASTVIRYIWSAKENPVRSLQVVLGLEVSRTISPFSELDALYHHILGSAAHLVKVLQIIAHCLCTPLSSLTSIVCMMIDCSHEDLSIFMADMAPIMVLSPLSSNPHEQKVKLLHASLGDFLRDQARSGSLYVDEEVYLSSMLERYFQLLDLYSRTPGTQPDWPAYADRMFSIPYTMLRSQIFLAVKKSGHLVATQRVLRQHSLRDFHQCQLRFKHLYQGIYDPPGPEDLSRFLAAVCSIKTVGGVMPFRNSVEEFLEILDSYLNLENRAISPAILPLICLGYPSQAMCRILSYHCSRLQSHRMIAEPIFDESMKPLTVLDVIATAGLDVHRGVNTTPKRLAAAAEAIMGYIFDRAHLHCTSLLSEHQSWLKRTKPRKHIAIGAPKLAVIIHTRYTRSLQLLEDGLGDIHARRHYGAVLPTKLQSLSMALGLKHPIWLDELYRRREKLEMVADLLDALLWVLPGADFSKKMVHYSKKSLPWSVYQRKTALCRRVRKSLDDYTARVQKVRLDEVGRRIEGGDVNALIEKSRMLHMDAQD